jgi:citrate synthase
MTTTKSPGAGWLTAAEAAALLRVSRTTLYAYVSRGYLRSQAAAGAAREHRYAREDVERLRRRTEERRDPDKAAAHALQWGMPILESSIALIDGSALYYRGHDAATLARERSIQEVASLVWTGRFDTTFVTERRSGSARGVAASADLPFVPRAQITLAHAGAADPLALDLRAENVARCGWQMLHLLTHTAGATARGGASIDRLLAKAWGVSDRHADVLRGALVLCADHELNVSSFTARCVASAGSHPYAVVAAGLAALEGPRHGGASARVESMLASLRGARNLTEAVTARIRRGDRVEGFGHPLYASGDPRAVVLIDLLRECCAGQRELRFVLDVAAAAAAATRERPNVDFALAAVARVLRLPAGAPLILFAIGRTIGWIGHAIEQYGTRQLIRPRAKYVGVMPAASAAPSA